MLYSRTVALLAIVSLGGCSRPIEGKSTDDPTAKSVRAPEPVAVPAELVGKWRFEVSDGGSTRVCVYRFTADGHLEIDVRLVTPDRKVKDLVKGDITKVDGNKLTIVDVSHTDEQGREDVIPPEKRRLQVREYRVSGDELTLRFADGKTNSNAQTVLKRVKE